MNCKFHHLFHKFSALTKLLILIKIYYRWKQLTAQNLLQKIKFNEDSEDYINDQINCYDISLSN